MKGCLKVRTYSFVQRGKIMYLYKVSNAQYENQES